MYRVYVLKFKEEGFEWRPWEKELFREDFINTYQVEPIIDEIGIDYPFGFSHTAGFIKGWSVARGRFSI